MRSVGQGAHCWSKAYAAPFSKAKCMDDADQTHNDKHVKCLSLTGGVNLWQGMAAHLYYNQQEVQTTRGASNKSTCGLCHDVTVGDMG